MVGTQALVEPQRKHNFPNGGISMTQVTPTCSVARRGRIPATGLSEKAPESRGYPLQGIFTQEGVSDGDKHCRVRVNTVAVPAIHLSSHMCKVNGGSPRSANLR